MNMITREALKARLDNYEPVQLVMALGDWEYQRMHIPGSQHFESIAEAAVWLSRDQDVVVYDTNPDCAASYRMYYALKCLGFTKIARYPGGLEDWTQAGLPVEGSMAGELAWADA